MRDFHFTHKKLYPNKLYCVLSPGNLIYVFYSKCKKGTKITRSNKKLL